MRPIFTRLLAAPTSHLARHMKSTYPNTLALRREARASVGPLLVQPGDSHPGTLGTAFDLLSGLLLVEDLVPLNPAPSSVWTPVHGIIAEVMTAFAQEALPRRTEDDNFYRAVWVMAELASVVRSGFQNPDSLLSQRMRAKPDMEQLLAITPPDGIRQLRELEAAATEQFYPHLEGPITYSASFNAVSDVVQAEADLVAGDLLIDLKSTVGTVDKASGHRQFFPSAADIYQVLGYALMDRDAQYGVEAVGFYAARFGDSLVWDLPNALGIAAGNRHVDVDAARDDFYVALRDDFNAAAE